VAGTMAGAAAAVVTGEMAGAVAGAVEPTVSDLYSGWGAAAKAAIDTLPKKERTSAWKRQRSQRTLDLVQLKIDELSAGARDRPGWVERKQELAKALRKSTVEDWREHCNAVADSLMEADKTEDFAAMAVAVRKLGGIGGGFCSTQPNPSAPEEEKAEAWAAFGEKKFEPTAAEAGRDPLEDLGPAEDRSDEKWTLTKEEILFCAKALRRSKACGEDQIPAEVFKEEGPLQDALIVLVQRIWQEEEVPEELVRGLFVMVYKGKGSSDDMTKYRCICLLNHAYKLLSAVLLRRLVGECEDWLPEHQAGFRKFRGCQDNIYILAALIDDVLGRDDRAFIVFIDFVAAFDSVSHKLLDAAMKAAGASDKCRAVFRAIYAKASAKVRVRSENGEETISRAFGIGRGVVQGDICSPYGYILALSFLFFMHDPEAVAGTGITLVDGTVIPALTYADDSALCCETAEEASRRVTAIRLGFRLDGDKEVSQPKTEAMAVRERLRGTASSEEEYSAALSQNDCEFCGKAFESARGCFSHQTGHCPADGKPWCPLAHREQTEEAFGVERILDVRGEAARGRRFYLVKWEGFDGDRMEESTWEPAEGLAEFASKAVDDFWEEHPDLDRSERHEVPGEWRCTYPGCCQPKPKERAQSAAEKTAGLLVPGAKVLYGKGSIYGSEAGLKRHMARCPCEPRSRAGTRSEKAMHRRQRVAAAEAEVPIKMKGDGSEPEDISFVFDFKYLGFWFQSDGDSWRHVEIRMAMAGSQFGKLRHIWADSRLSKRLKLAIYSTYIVSVLTWGLPAWKLGEAEQRKLRHWNARQLTRLLQTKAEDYAEVVRKQFHEPEFDLVGKLRARRMRWLGHTLRLAESSLLRQVMMRGETPQPGSVLADEAVPAHSSMEELAELAGNHDTKEGKLLCAQWGEMCAALEGCGGGSLPVNLTAEKTDAALEQIGGHQLRLYTDGGCDGNGANGVWGAAGWGVHVLEWSPLAEPPTLTRAESIVRADLWGPVETGAESDWFCGAEKGTNNTGELIGIGQALMWLRDVAAKAELSAPSIVETAAVMLYDSAYAANMATGRWKASSNVALVAWVRKLLAEVEESGRTVHWVHVKGHSADGGNDKADERVQWGKEAGPYARLREGGGEGESRYGAATRVALSGDEPSAMPVVDGRRGFGAADQAIEVFENLVGGLVRVVCEEEVCEQWRSLRETK